MNKKNIIQVTIIVACMAASAIVIYNNFFKKTAPPPQLAAATGAAKAEGAIFPNGTGFNLDMVKKSLLRFNLLDYPKLNYPGEVGEEETNLIRPLKSGPTQ